MTSTSCPVCINTGDYEETLPQTIAARVEGLRQERLRAYAERIGASSAMPRGSRLEKQVDALLDSLNTLHRLEQLAAHAARGGQITVDADRLLIAENEETFLSLVSRFDAQPAVEAIIHSNLLFTKTPPAID